MTVLAMLCAIGAFALFARASGAGGRHSVKDCRRLRSGSWALLLLVVMLSIMAKGWVFGPILATGLVMLAAGVVFLVVNLVASPSRS